MKFQSPLFSELPLLSFYTINVIEIFFAVINLQPRVKSRTLITSYKIKKMFTYTSVIRLRASIKSKTRTVDAIRSQSIMIDLLKT